MHVGQPKVKQNGTTKGKVVIIPKKKGRVVV